MLPVDPIIKNQLCLDSGEFLANSEDLILSYGLLDSLKSTNCNLKFSIKSKFSLLNCTWITKALPLTKVEITYYSN